MIARKTYRELWPMLLVYVCIMEILLLPAIVLWPDLQLIAKNLGPVLTLTKFLSSSIFKDVIESVTNYGDYYALQVFFKGVNICGSAAAVVIGTGLIARERENHTLEFLMTRPISPSRILIEKYLVAAVGLVLPIFIVAWSGIPLSAWLVDEPISFVGITFAAIHSSIFVLCILTMTTLFSVIFRLQSYTAAVSGVFIVSQATLFFIQTARQFSIFQLSDIDVYAPILSGDQSFTQVCLWPEIWMVSSILVVYLVADRLMQRIRP